MNTNTANSHTEYGQLNTSYCYTESRYPTQYSLNKKQQRYYIHINNNNNNNNNPGTPHESLLVFAFIRVFF